MIEKNSDSKCRFTHTKAGLLKCSKLLSFPTRSNRIACHVHMSSSPLLAPLVMVMQELQHSQAIICQLAASYVIFKLEKVRFRLCIGHPQVNSSESVCIFGNHVVSFQQIPSSPE